jgi:hypothetical protein
MTTAVIRELRKQGFGLIKPADCVSAERYVARHPEIFCADTDPDRESGGCAGGRPASLTGA